MKLYYTPGACSLACRIIINEIGIPCEYVSVDLHGGKQTQFNEDYNKINPKGSVPALELDNGELLTENAVILQYLADSTHSTQLLPEVGDFNRYRVLEWVNFIATDMHKGLGVFFTPLIPDELKESVFRPLIKKKLAYLNDYLADKQYLLGDHFTLPDAYLFVITSWTILFHFNIDETPNLKRYFTRLHRHPAIQKSLQQEQLKINPPQ